MCPILRFSYITRILPCLMVAIPVGFAQAQTPKDARLQQGTTIKVSQGNRQALIKEAGEGESDNVRRLLTQKFSQSDKDAALLKACEMSIHRRVSAGVSWVIECESIVQLLLEAGANPNATTKMKETPLLLLSNRMPTAEQFLLLLKHRAKVNAADAHGYTALVNMISEKTDRYDPSAAGKRGRPECEVAVTSQNDPPTEYCQNERRQGNHRTAGKSGREGVVTACREMELERGILGDGMTEFYEIAVDTAEIEVFEPKELR